MATLKNYLEQEGGSYKKISDKDLKNLIEKYKPLYLDEDFNDWEEQLIGWICYDETEYEQYLKDKEFFPEDMVPDKKFNFNVVRSYRKKDVKDIVRAYWEHNEWVNKQIEDQIYCGYGIGRD